MSTQRFAVTKQHGNTAFFAFVSRLISFVFTFL
jgi:hypothetical protein